MAKRQWSREFTPRTRPAKNKKPKVINLNVSNVPPTLRQKFQAKCRRVNKSQRNLLLGWIRNWVADRRPDEDPHMGPLSPPIDPVANDRSPV